MLRTNSFFVDVLSRRGSISFENTDITVSIKTPNGEKIAEAFNATNGVMDYRKMRWVSLGIPRLLSKKEEANPSKVYVYIANNNKLLNSPPQQDVGVKWLSRKFSSYSNCYLQKITIYKKLGVMPNPRYLWWTP